MKLDSLIRWLLVKLCGVPLCGGCVANQVDCVGWCGMTNEQRVDAFLAHRRALGEGDE